MSTANTTFLIDDEPNINTINKIYLRRNPLSAEVEDFTDPEIALDKITSIDSEERYIILIDIFMPKMTGFELASALSEKLDHKKYYVVILSSSIDPKDEQQATSIPIVQRFISKPLDNDKIDEIMKDSESYWNQIN